MGFRHFWGTFMEYIKNDGGNTKFIYDPQLKTLLSHLIFL